MESAALDKAPVWSDVKTFDGKPWCGFVDSVTGGYPCQPFSVAGKQLGTADPRHVWPHIAERVKEIKPQICFFENVRGHLRLGFREVRDELRSMGYGVRAGLFTANETGANHERYRLFILAYAENPDRRNAATGETGGGEPPNQVAGPSGRVDQEECVVYTSRKDLERQWSSGYKEGRQEPHGHAGLAGRTGLPVYTYGPGELSKWAETLTERPDLAPAVKSGVRLLADGVACDVDEYRNEQLMCGGNGVVPLQAAYAFVTLVRSAGIA
jgi:DNA (cytosine-5)-methyltransferase 1